MYTPFDPAFWDEMHRREIRANDLAWKYPNLGNDDLQKGSALREMLFSGRGAWIIDCPTRRPEATLIKTSALFDSAEGIRAGMVLQLVANEPDGPASGFMLSCYESFRDLAKSKLKSIGVQEAAMSWITEADLSRQHQTQANDEKASRRNSQRANRHRSPKPRISNEDDLFDLMVSEDNAHPQFLGLRESPYAGARELINDFFADMGDINGHFKRDFQSSGHYPRLFEIACYAYLSSQGLKLDRQYESPDFVVTGNDNEIQMAIEAVTANPTVPNSDLSASHINESLTEDDYLDKVSNEFPIRVGRALLGKIRKKYWELPQCQGVPLVLIVAPMYEPGPASYTDESLARYLYGGWDEWPDYVKRNGLYTRITRVNTFKYQNKSLQRPFFDEPRSKYISAVVYANQFTASKFERLAIQDGRDVGLSAEQFGFYLTPSQDRFDHLNEFEFVVGSEQAPRETWEQGVTVFLNPSAVVPLDPDSLAATHMFERKDGALKHHVRGFHPLTSYTIFHSA